MLLQVLWCNLCTKNLDVIDAYLPQEINDVLFNAVKDMVLNGKTATEAAQDVQTAYDAMKCNLDKLG